MTVEVEAYCQYAILLALFQMIFVTDIFANCCIMIVHIGLGQRIILYVDNFTEIADNLWRSNIGCDHRRLVYEGQDFFIFYTIYSFLFIWIRLEFESPNRIYIFASVGENLCLYQWSVSKLFRPIFIKETRIHASFDDIT